MDEIKKENAAQSGITCDEPQDSDKIPSQEDGNGSAGIVSEFFVTTTAHGFLHIVQNSIYLRIVWALLIVIAFGGFGLHLSTLVEKYLSYPLTTEIRYSEVEFEFPDVTVCLTTKYRHCLNIDVRDPRIGLVTNSTVPSLGNYHFWSALNNTFTFWKQAYGLKDDLLIKYSTVGMRGYTYEINITNRRTDIATGIEYKQKALNLDNVVAYDDPELFRCATVRPKDRAINSVNDAMGLILSIFDQYIGNKTTPLIDRAWVAGVRVTLSEPNARPNLINSFIVPPGTIKHTKVSMTRQEKRKTPKQDCYESSNDLPIQVLNPDGTLSSYRYTQSDCRELELQKYVMRKCGCVSNFKLVPAEFKSLSGSLKYCLDLDPTILKAKKIFLANSSSNGSQTLLVEKFDSSVVPMELILAQTGFRAQHECHLKALGDFVASAETCPPSCVAYTYQAYSSESLWPFQIDQYFAERILNLFQSAYNYSLEKGLPVPLFKCFEAGATITSKDYWKMIGYFQPGGLYVGVSVISVCEFLEFLTLLTVHWHRKPISVFIDSAIDKKKKSFKSCGVQLVMNKAEAFSPEGHQKAIVNSPSKSWVFCRVICVAISFVLLLSSYYGIKFMQSSINAQQGLGTASLAVVYASVLFSSLVLANPLVETIGPKHCLSFAMLGYMSYIAFNAYPSFYTLIPASMIVGLCSAPLWASMARYNMQLASLYSAAAGGGKSLAASSALVFGLFYAISNTSYVWGNLISYLTLRTENRPVNASSGSNSSAELRCGSSFCPSDLESGSRIVRPTEERLHIMVGCFLASSAAAALIVTFLV
uniref:Amiloride-sensitive sodium channel n=2 Tax=Macrostomum lignano TaxID=282301 RepID=A0A1I8J7I0_9PLAT